MAIFTLIRKITKLTVSLVKYGLLIGIGVLTLITALSFINNKKFLASNAKSSSSLQPAYSKMSSSNAKASPVGMTADEFNQMMIDRTGKGIWMSPSPVPNRTSNPDQKITCYVAKDGNFQMTSQQCNELGKNNSWWFIETAYNNCLDGHNPEIGNSGSRESRTSACDTFFNYSARKKIRDEAEANYQKTLSEYRQKLLDYADQQAKEQYAKQLEAYNAERAKLLEQCYLDIDHNSNGNYETYPYSNASIESAQNRARAELRAVCDTYYGPIAQ